jgi:soluble lytic murein transglycosylase-like protein
MITGGHALNARRTLHSLWIIAYCVASLAFAPKSSAQELTDIRTAALTPGAAVLREADPPSVLSPADIARYRSIFALQQSQRWAEADHEIAGLSDKLLLGEVLGERYRSAAYKATYVELAQWLQKYGDEPAAKAIYAMALKRHLPGTPPVPKPVASGSLAQAGDDADFEPQPTAGGLALGAPATAHRGDALASQIRDLAPDQPRKAELMLASGEAKVLIDVGTRDELRAAIAEGYLGQGEPQEALTLSATTESAAYAPIANWNAGLAAWRLDRLDEARGHFQALARSPNQSGWIKSAAAFWAARVELKARRPENYSYWLRIAAESPRTFYGLLARRLLGVDQAMNFPTDPFTEFDAQLLTNSEAGRRTLALLAVDQRQLAALELRQLASHGSPALIQSLASLADRANLPAASLQLAATLSTNDALSHDPALYPVPRWEPLGGFTVDRALIFALMRQESQFVPQAYSRSGATGLMQLMPATARSMAKRTGTTLAAGKGKAQRRQLTDPEYNLMLAQEYVEELLSDDHIKGNLILFAAAYNHGPAAASRWLGTRDAYRDDPLLFIESIPSQQSRVFTLRVLTNYWIYRQRLNQGTPDLDALADGHWPTYTALDGKTVETRHAQN